ncbi:MAG: glycerol-3-phosphate 1-O-acyltransferase PlsY [Candidatus Nanopelagicales bacterium]
MTGFSLWWLPVTAIGGYFIGAINPASIIARARGIDLHQLGSGNPGATNAGRVMGRKTGALVLLLDLLKGVVAVLLFTWLVTPELGAFAGFMSILGHMTSPFLKGKGGKGVATTIGVLLAAEPIWLVPVLVVFAVVFVIVRRTGIASVAAALALIVTAILDRNDSEMTVIGVLIGLLVIIRHGRNIREAWQRLRSPTVQTPVPGPDGGNPQNS